MLKKVKSFLRTRSHVLVVVGALIVFLTFVIKEGLREHWKGNADAIETAEYFYPLLAQSAEIKKELRKEGNGMNSMLPALGETQSLKGCNRSRKIKRRNAKSCQAK